MTSDFYGKRQHLVAPLSPPLLSIRTFDSMTTFFPFCCHFFILLSFLLPFRPDPLAASGFIPLNTGFLPLSNPPLADIPRPSGYHGLQEHVLPPATRPADPVIIPVTESSKAAFPLPVPSLPSV